MIEYVVNTLGTIGSSYSTYSYGAMHVVQLINDFISSACENSYNYV